MKPDRLERYTAFQRRSQRKLSVLLLFVSNDRAASYTFKPCCKLVAALTEDLERLHIQLKIHLLAIRRRCIQLEAAVIDLHIVDVFITALLERLGDPRAFFVRGGTVLRRSWVSRRSSLRDEDDSCESPNNSGNHFSTLIWSPWVFKPEAPLIRRLPGRKGSKAFFPSKIFSSVGSPLASFCSKGLTRYHDLP